MDASESIPVSDPTLPLGGPHVRGACVRCGAAVSARSEEPVPVHGWRCTSGPCVPLDPDPLDVMEEREREYERQLRRDGLEP